MRSSVNLRWKGLVRWRPRDEADRDHDNAKTKFARGEEVKNDVSSRGLNALRRTEDSSAGE